MFPFPLTIFISTFPVSILFPSCAFPQILSNLERHSVVLLASYPGFWWAERERAWYPLFKHVHNYLLLNTCSDKSGRGMRNTYPRDW